MHPTTIMARALLSCAIVTGMAVICGCGDEPAESGVAQVGNLSIPLQTIVGANTYRLQAAIVIRGATGSITLETNGDEPVLSASLPAGSYSASIESFTLSRADRTGTFVPVTATLVSGDQYFTVFANATTRVSFQFQTDGTTDGASGSGGSSGNGGSGGSSGSGASAGSGTAGGSGGSAGGSGSGGAFVPPLVPRHTTGAQSTVVILLSDDPAPDTGPANPPSIAGVTSRLNDIDASLRKFSFGTTWLDPVRIVGPYAGEIPRCTIPFSSGNSQAIAEYAIERADPEVDFRFVDRVIVFLALDLGSSCDINPNGGFNFELQSADGAFSAGLMMMYVDYPFDQGYPDPIVVHEFTHTLGTGHISGLKCYTSPAQQERVPYGYVLGVLNGFPASDRCPFGDFSPLDVMGDLYAPGANVNGPLKRQFGWVGPQNVVTTRAGTYTLRPLDSSTSPVGTLMLEIPIPYTTNSYTLEYRTEVPTPGVYLYLAEEDLRAPVVLPFLLATAPYDPSQHPLASGVTLIDAAMGLEVEVLSSDPDGAVVEITSDSSYVTQCTDGLNNDSGYGSGAFDGADFSCTAGTGLSEAQPPAACFNGVDDDGDGLADEQDPGCNPDGQFQPEQDHE